MVHLNYIPFVFQGAILFGLPWSIGAVIDVDGRAKFDESFRNIVSGKNEDHPIPKLIGKIETPFPDAGLVYDYCYEVS